MNQEKDEYWLTYELKEEAEHLAKLLRHPSAKLSIKHREGYFEPSVELLIAIHTILAAISESDAIRITQLGEQISYEQAAELLPTRYQTLFDLRNKTLSEIVDLHKSQAAQRAIHDDNLHNAFSPKQEDD